MKGWTETCSTPVIPRGWQCFIRLLMRTSAEEGYWIHWHRSFLISVHPTLLIWLETCLAPINKSAYTRHAWCLQHLCLRYTLRKQSTFRDAIAGFHAKWRLSNDWRNPILLTRHLPDLGPSDRLKQIFHMAQPTRSTDTSSVWNFWRSFLRRYLVGKPVNRVRVFYRCNDGS